MKRSALHPVRLVLLVMVMASGLPPAPASSAADGERQGRALPAQAAPCPKRELERFLEVYNTGDRDALRRYAAGHFSRAALEKAPAEFYASWLADAYRGLRALTLRRVERSAEREIVALCESDLTELWVRIRVRVEAQPPHGVSVGWEEAEAPAETLRRGRRSRAAIVSEADSFVRRVASAGVFSGAVLIAGPRGATSGWTFGAAPEARRSIASVGKLFTSVAIAQLEQAGRLSLSDPIGCYLPEYPNREAAAKVTVGHLLTHTSGIADYMDRDAYQAARREAGGRLARLEDYLPFFAADPLGFEPGARDEYSNSGYVVLGLIVERLSGMSFSEYVAAKIFGPAGMSATDPGTIAPAGGEESTTRDLLGFALALRGGRLLDGEHTRRVLEPRAVAGTANPYGFEVRRVGVESILGHQGGAPGLSAGLDLYLRSGYTVAVLASADHPAARIVTGKLERLIAHR